MPTRDSAPIGSPCWVDLMTSDTERSRSFYGLLFGWKAEGPQWGGDRTSGGPARIDRVARFLEDRLDDQAAPLATIPRRSAPISTTSSAS